MDVPLIPVVLVGCMRRELVDVILRPFFIIWERCLRARGKQVSKRASERIQETKGRSASEK